MTTSSEETGSPGQGEAGVELQPPSFTTPTKAMQMDLTLLYSTVTLSEVNC